MRSIGIDLEQWVNKGILQFHATRPTLYGLETHITNSNKLINSFKPSVVILDPIDAFVMGENQAEVKTMLLRLVDFLKMKRITAFFTSLTAGDDNKEITDVYVSSLIDTWLLLRDIEIGGERNRGLYVLKSRGMAHSNQIREFRLTAHGIELLDVYVGADGVLTGTARISQEARDRAQQVLNRQEISRKQLELKRKREVLEAQIKVLRSEYESVESDALRTMEIEKARLVRFTHTKETIAKSRKSDVVRRAAAIKKKHVE